MARRRATVAAVVIVGATALLAMQTSAAPLSSSNAALPLSVSTPAPALCTPAMVKDTRWGVATASYQVEGAWNKGGRTPSVWDTFSHNGRVDLNQTGDVACDMYHKYRQDFKLMRSMGIKHYRFSFSWNRIFPEGRAGTPINPEGVAFYNNLIDAMIAEGIRPYATLFHWDLPQSLQDRYGGFLGEELADDFFYYANALFATYGDRVKDWMTFNEPWVTCVLQWGQGVFAPGIDNGEKGQFACGHNLLIAHGKAAQLYRDVYKPIQKGRLGIALNIEWGEPGSDSEADKAAAQRKMDMDLGWFADPLFLGDYPETVKRTVGKNLPTLSEDDKKRIKGSLDFLGINYYTGKWVVSDGTELGYNITDVLPSPTSPDGKKFIGPLAESFWLRVVPWSFRSLLKYVDARYGAPEMMITENGVSVPKENDLSKSEVLVDPFRVEYYKSYLNEMCKAMSEGVKVSTYFAWSFMDNFEWKEGYITKFGITHVDFNSPELTRTVKESGRWLSRHFFKQGRV